MNNRLAIFIAVFLVVIVFTACVIGVLKIDFAPAETPDKPVERTRQFGEGLKLAQHGLYGIDLVSIGKAHMRKLRKGPFTIGAVNELVLEDVALVLPEELWKGEKDEGQKTKDKGVAGQEGEDGAEPGPSEMLSKLGLDVGKLKFGDKMPRFSALKVVRLQVSRLEGTNAVPWFTAANGKAERSGLRLKSGWTVESGGTNAWNKAFLVVSPKVALIPLP